MDDFTFRSVKFEPVQFKTNSLTSLPLKDIRDGLVLDTGFTVRRGSDDVDQSGEHSDLTLSGPSRAKGMGNMNALSFDGIDDFLYDKIYATEEGTVYISTANGQAFLIDTGQDFSDYVGDGSDNGYMIVVYDGEDEVAWSYLGAEGSGETLGSELTTNGDIETGDTTGWTSYFNAGAGAAGSITATAIDKYSGTYSLKVNITGTGVSLLSIQIGNYPFATTENKIYKITFAIKGSTNFDDVYIRVIKNVAPFTSASNSLYYDVTTEWVEHTFYFSAVNTEAVNRINFNFGSVGTGDIYIDDVSIKEVTPALGSELVTNGDFTNWTGDDPDDWTVTEVGDATSNVTENPAGQCQIISDGTLVAITQAILTVGKLYKYSVDIKTITSGELGIGSGTNSWDHYDSTGVKTGYFTATHANFIIKRFSGATNIIFDDVSVKEVTAPPSTIGIKLYSTINGSTENMAGVDASFDPNDTLTYEVRKTSFQVSTGDFSYVVLLKTSSSAQDFIVYKAAGGLEAGLKFFLMYINNGLVYVQIDDDVAMKLVISSSTINDNQWHVLVGSYDRSGNLTLYIDGAEDGTPIDISGVATIENSNYFEVGSKLKSQNLLTGQIGLVRFYRGVALTAAQVRQLYNYILYKAGMVDIPYRGM